MEAFVQDQEFEGPPTSLINETIQEAMKSIATAN
jgi:hypothetical protein